MGTWATVLFAYDLACDIRDHYRELIEEGVDDAEATRKTVEKLSMRLMILMLMQPNHSYAAEYVCPVCKATLELRVQPI